MDKKFLVIGDIHGSPHWKDIINNQIKNINDSYIYFLGDYCDSHEYTGRQCIDNMIQIFELAEKHKDNIFLCLGNHDYHYMRFSNQKYSGYKYEYALDYYDILTKYAHLFKIVYEIATPSKNIFISHAGITKTFLKRANVVNPIELNDVFKENPQLFGFDMNSSDIYGDCITQSPLWVRPIALVQDMYKGYHIVGHTYVPFPQVLDNMCIVCSHDKNNFITNTINKGE